MVLPVRGLHLTDTGPLPDLFASPWTIVGHAQFNALERSFDKGVQFQVRKMREQAFPTAIFLYRYSYPTVYVAEAARLAESALSALSMAVLLHPWEPSDLDGGVTNPRPVFRARYAEYYDMPMGLSRAGVKIIGGGKSVFSLLRPDWVSPERRISRNELECIVLDAPEVVSRVLHQETLTKRQRKLADGMTVIVSAFQTLSAGAFVSSLVSAMEVLVDSQSGADGAEFGSSWNRRLARIRVALGPGCDTALNRVLKVRHDYVHSGGQPPNDLLAFTSLGMAVQVWSVVAELFSRVESTQDLEALLDAVAVARRATKLAPRSLRFLSEEVPVGVRDRLPWINYWLERAISK